MDIYIKLFEVIFPVFFVVGIGYYLGKKNPKIDTSFITNFGANIGSSSGAGIAEHLHFHIVPRWSGDTNFMPVVGQTKVHVQGLQDTYNDLIKLFEEIKL